MYNYLLYNIDRYLKPCPDQEPFIADFVINVRDKMFL